MNRVIPIFLVSLLVVTISFAEEMNGTHKTIRVTYPMGIVSATGVFPVHSWVTLPNDTLFFILVYRTLLQLKFFYHISVVVLFL